jgi:hypothetical protein
VHAQLLQRRRGKARAVALGTHDDRVQVVVGEGQPVRGGGVEPPLQRRPRDDDGSGDLALLRPLIHRAGVDEHGAVRHCGTSLLGAEPYQPGSRLRQHVVDRAPRRGHGACGTRVDGP